MRLIALGHDRQWLIQGSAFAVNIIQFNLQASHSEKGRERSKSK